MGPKIKKKKVETVELVGSQSFVGEVNGRMGWQV